MKRSISILVVAIVLAGLGFLLYRKLFPTDETLIRRMLDTVAATASVSPDEKPLTRLSRAAQLAAQFAGTVTMNVDISGLQGRTIQTHEELAQLIAGARANVSDAKVEFIDANITINNDHAQVHTTAFIRISGQGDPTVQELNMGLVKPDGRWRIERVETVRTLK